MKVKFVPQNVEFDIKPGESVMHVAQDHGLYIKSVCKGVPSCAECRVRVVEGEHNVLPPGSEELALIGTGHFIDRRRLSCQLKCFGDITVDMTEQIDKQATGGKKSRKQVVKDDRVEESVAIRGGSFEEESDSAPEAEVRDKAPEKNAQRQEAQQKQRPQNQRQNSQNREGSGKPKPQQAGQQGGPRNQQRNQNPQAGGPQSREEGGEGGTKKRRRRRRGRGGSGGQQASSGNGGQGQSQNPSGAPGPVKNN